MGTPNRVCLLVFCTSTATAAPFSSLSTVVLTTLTSLFGFGIVSGFCASSSACPAARASAALSWVDWHADRPTAPERTGHGAR